MRQTAIFLHENGLDYVAEVDGRWLRWPAQKDGWALRRPATDDDIEWADVLPERLAGLAVRLSGAELP